jgi:hypothetical protein
MEAVRAALVAAFDWQDRNDLNRVNMRMRSSTGPEIFAQFFRAGCREWCSGDWLPGVVVKSECTGVKALQAVPNVLGVLLEVLPGVHGLTDSSVPSVVHCASPLATRNLTASVTVPGGRTGPWDSDRRSSSV